MPTTDEPLNPAPKRRGTLLVVDDEDGPRESMRVIFKGEYDLLMAEDGPTAIELAKQNNIDVAVLDIRMAGMSGIEVLERLKYLNPDIEAIMMTAFETTETIRKALQLRACDYLNKPFDLATMRAAVSQAMQRRMLGSEMNSSAEKVRQLLADLENQRIVGQIAQKRADILASIIHDINNPLTVISGLLELLNHRVGRLMRAESEDLEFIKKRLKIITEQAVTCINISQHYLDILREKPGQSTPRVSVNLLLKDLKRNIEVHPSLRENEFSLVSSAEDIGVKVGSMELTQMLQNLAVNALQCASQPHRAEVGCEVLRSPLDLATFKDGPNDRLLNIESMDNTAPLVKFWVRDTGPGIPAEVLPKIFDPYFTTKGPARRHWPWPEHRPAVHQKRQRRVALSHETRRRHDLHGLSAGGGTGEVKFNFKIRRLA